MKAELILIPRVSINHNSINLYNEVHWEPHRPERKFNDEMNVVLSKEYKHLLSSDRSAKGKVSKIAKRKITKALDYMLLMANNKSIHNIYSGRTYNFKISFITLTLPSQQKHDDNTIKSQCLNQLLIELKKHYHVHNYIWRAEKQKNGNLHFHIITDKFIPYQELRDRWNRVINKLGYVDAYRHEMQVWHKNGFRVRKNLLKTWPLKKQKAAYERGSRTHWNSPNSTDIHSIRKILNIKKYISKYLTKNEIRNHILKIEKLNEIRESKPESLIKIPSKKRKELQIKKRKRQLAAKKMKQKGRIWGCNQELSNIKGAQAIADNDLQKEIKDLQNTPGVTTYNDVYFSVVSFNPDILLNLRETQLFKLFCQYLLDKFNYSLQTEIAS